MINILLMNAYNITPSVDMLEKKYTYQIYIPCFIIMLELVVEVLFNTVARSNLNYIYIYRNVRGGNVDILSYPLK